MTKRTEYNVMCTVQFTTVKKKQENGRNAIKMTVRVFKIK